MLYFFKIFIISGVIFSPDITTATEGWHDIAERAHILPFARSVLIRSDFASIASRMLTAFSGRGSALSLSV
jgi:hypothetical protein